MTNHHSSHSDNDSDRPSARRRSIALISLAAATLTLAACGTRHSGAPSPSQRTQAEAPLIAYAKCMRSHGVSKFPNPSIGPEGGIGYSSAQTQAVDRTSPAYHAAMRECQNLPAASTAQQLLK
jgi:hypothetical protein